MKNNYGFAGKNFVRAVILMKPEELEQRRDDLYKQIAREDKMQKQAYAMSVIMLADRITEELFFNDGVIISPEEAVELMTERESVSDNQRAYEYIMDKLGMDEMRFDPASDKAIEQWGFRSDGYVCFYIAALNNLLKEEGYGVRPFLAWLDKRGMLDKDGGKSDRHLTKQGYVKGKRFRVYKIKIVEDITNDDEPETLQWEDYTQTTLDLEGIDLP